MTLVADFNSSVNVPFQRARQMLLDMAVQEGVVGATDLMVVQRGAGVNQSVDVGAGFAWVKVDTGTRNGMGHVTNDATANVTVTASNGSNPRIDQIVLRWNDSSIPTGAGNIPTLEVLTGTATSGATLDNRTGAAALPNDCLRLADLLIPTSSTTISNTQIRDRRPWARGFYDRIVLTTGGPFTATAGGAMALISSSMNPRLECSGVPVRMRLRGRLTNAAAGSVFFAPFIDGAATDSMTDTIGVNTAGALEIGPGPGVDWEFVPTAGSHTLGWAWRAVTANGTLQAATATPLLATFEEIVKTNSPNNSVTSG